MDSYIPAELTEFNKKYSRFVNACLTITIDPQAVLTYYVQARNKRPWWSYIAPFSYFALLEKKLAASVALTEAVFFKLDKPPTDTSAVEKAEQPK